MKPLRVAILTSRNAAGIERLLTDPNRGAAWELPVVVGADSSLEQLDLIERSGVPVELRPIRHHSGWRNLRSREEYDDLIGELLQRANVDYVLLLGHNYIVTDPLLARFAGRVLALHDGDLSLRDRTLYGGRNAVRDAIFGGEPDTRSSVYVVTKDIGRGPLFLLGPVYPLAHMALDAREQGNADFLKRYATLHREWMVSTSWGDILARTLELLAAGTTTTLGDVVWVDGAPGPCRMGEGPRCCHDPETMVSRGIPRSCPFIG